MIRLLSQLSLLITIVLFSACGLGGENTEEIKENNGEKNTELLEQINGKWNLKEAYRSGELVELPPVYIDFKSNGVLESNIPTSPTEKPYADGVNYEVVGNTIVNDATNNTFDISEVTDTSLILKTELMDLDFKLVFKK